MGFAALPNQLHRKSVKKGFDFTLMVAGLWVLERDPGGSDVLWRSWPPSHLTRRSVVFIGESGLGKSTLINSLFLTNLYEDRQVPDASGKICAPLPDGLPYPAAVLVFYRWCPWLFQCHQTAFFFCQRLFPPLKYTLGVGAGV